MQLKEKMPVPLDVGWHLLPYIGSTCATAGEALQVRNALL